MMQQRMINIDRGGMFHHLRLTYSLTELKYLPESSPQEILYLAELVLADAVRTGVPFRQYEDNYRSMVTPSFIMLQNVQQAIVNDEFTIHLQPKVRLDNATAYGD